MPLVPPKPEKARGDFLPLASIHALASLQYADGWALLFGGFVSARSAELDGDLVARSWL